MFSFERARIALFIRMWGWEVTSTSTEYVSCAKSHAYVDKGQGWDGTGNLLMKLYIHCLFVFWNIQVREREMG